MARFAFRGSRRSLFGTLGRKRRGSKDCRRLIAHQDRHAAPLPRPLRLESLEARLLLAADAPVDLLRDINQEIPGSRPTEIVQVGNQVFISADDAIHGHELFLIQEGSPPQLVKDILPGFAGSQPTHLTDVGGTLFFVADDGEHGRELWKSDGTAAGTQMVADIYPGMSEFLGVHSSDPSDLTPAATPTGTKLFFVAENATTGRELWMADASGAELVIDIYPGVDTFDQPHSSTPRDLTFVPLHQNSDGNIIQPALFYAAENEANGRELWKTNIVDGNTQSSLLKNIFEDIPGSDANSSDPAGLIRFQNQVYFRARDGLFENEGELVSNGIELWRSDGTVAGTELVIDIFPGMFTNVNQQVVFNSSVPDQFAVHQGSLYFRANNGATGSELWKSDGTAENTQLVRDIRPGSIGSSPSQLTSTDGFLYFAATGIQGRELWRSDGTMIGTQLTRDVDPGNGSALPVSAALAPLGDSVVFAANDGTLGPEVWISDGTSEGTRLLKEIQFGRNSAAQPDAFLSVDSTPPTVFFQHTNQLWKTDGSEPGTTRVPLQTEATEDAFASSFSPFMEATFAYVNNTLVFAADDGQHGIELWKSDGSTGGTELLADIAAGNDIIFPGSVIETPRDSEPASLTTVGNQAFFTAVPEDDRKLMVTDGRTTTLVGSDIRDPSELTSFAGSLYFVAHSDAAGRELWKSDGSEAGTQMVVDLLTDADSSDPGQLTVVGNQLFFVAQQENGRQLYVTDASGAGPTPLDIVPDGSGFPEQLTVFGNRLYFTAEDGQHGRELWTSDGTLEGTVMVHDIFVPEGIDPTGSQPILLTGLNGAFFFFADDGTNGQSLWSTDGTSAATAHVKSFRADGEPVYRFHEGTLSAARHVTLFQNRLFFAADDGDHGRELWSTDGTTAGTQLLKDLFPESEGSDPAELTVVGDHLFFAANQASALPDAFGDFHEAGRELWTSDGTAEGTKVLIELNTVDDRGSEPEGLANFGGTLFFVATDGKRGREVWTTQRRLQADDNLFEILARDVAYRDALDEFLPPEERTPIGLGDTISLAALTYSSPFIFTVDLVIHDEATGFDAYGLIADNANPILAIRGSADIADFYSDVIPAGVGVNQFEANRDAIRDWVSAATVPGRPVSITGHSLGGALTQLFAADLTDSGQLLDQVVTFNAPGIDQLRADPFDLALTSRVMHYVTNGDPVSLAGDAFITGSWRRSNFSDLWLPHNHQLPVLNDFVVADDPDTLILDLRTRPDDLEFESYDNVDWLNQPFYFHTDVDYFLWLAAARLATDNIAALRDFRDIPPALLFRSTTEAFRQQVGAPFAEIQGAVDELIDTLSCQSPNSMVMVPDVEFDVLGLLTVQASNLSAGCVADPDPQLRLQGTVVLPQLRNATADFTGDNYIGLSATGFDVVGQLSVEEIPMVPGAWSLEEVFVELDTTNQEIVAGGTLEIPTGIDLSAALGFVAGELDFATVGASGLNRPFGTTGVFLQSIAGRVDHLATGDPAPVSLGGAIGATGGPMLSISLPDWAGGDFDGSLLRLDVDGDIDRNHLTADGFVEIIGGLATADGTVELNWDQGFLEASGQLNLLDELITAETTFRADSQLNINLFADATFQVPDGIPLIGGQDALSGQLILDYRNDSTFSNDFIATWTDFQLPLIGTTQLGFRLYFDGGLGLIGGEAIAEIEATVPAPLPADLLTTGPIAAEPEAMAPTSLFRLPEDKTWVLFAAEWENDSPGTSLLITTPDGQTLGESDFASRTDIALVPELSDLRRRVVVVQNPGEGDWILSLEGHETAVDARFRSLLENASPQIDVVSVSGGQGRSPVEITFDAFDPDSDATVSFYYDTDMEGHDGVLFASGIAEADGRQSITWDPTTAAAGDYFIYAGIDDGVNPPVFVYAINDVDTTVPALPLVLPESLVTAADSEGDPRVRVLDADGNERLSFFAYSPSFIGGVRVATGDVNGDGVLDIITAPGAEEGGTANPLGPLVKVFDGFDGSELRSFFAYDPGFLGGVRVATGDVDGDGRADIVTGPGSGEPEVKVFDAITGRTASAFFAFDASDSSGIHVTTGDINGNGQSEIIVGAGPGGGPTVRIFEGVDAKMLHQFFAYDSSFTHGVRVAAGDVNGDGLADIITGAGPGAGPHVKVFDANPATGAMPFATELADFFAFTPEFLGGVSVAAGDFNHDRRADVIVGAGPGGGPHVRVFDGNTSTLQPSFFGLADDFTGGVTVSSTPPSLVHVLNLHENDRDYELVAEGDDLVVRQRSGTELHRLPKEFVPRLRINGSAQRSDLLSLQIAALDTPIVFSGGGNSGDHWQVIHDAPVHSVEQRADSPRGGAVSIQFAEDAPQQTQSLLYMGLESSADQLDAAHRKLLFSSQDDALTLARQHPLIGNQWRIDVDQAGSITFPGPSAELTIDLEAMQGADRLAFDTSYFTAMSESTRHLRIAAGPTDRVELDTDWVFTGSELVEGDLVRQLSQAGLSLQIIGPHDWTNPVRAADVDANGEVEPFDALLVIHELNRRRYSSAAENELISPAALGYFPNLFLDPTRDGRVEPLDALRVINALFRALRDSAFTVVEAEGESANRFNAAPESLLDARTVPSLDPIDAFPIPSIATSDAVPPPQAMTMNNALDGQLSTQRTAPQYVSSATGLQRSPTSSAALRMLVRGDQRTDAASVAESCQPSFPELAPLDEAFRQLNRDLFVDLGG